MKLICPDHNYSMVSNPRSLRERLDWRSTWCMMVILQGSYSKISYVFFIQRSGFGNYPHLWWLDWEFVVCLSLFSAFIWFVESLWKILQYSYFKWNIKSRLEKIFCFAFFCVCLPFLHMILFHLFVCIFMLPAQKDLPQKWC